MTTLTCTVETMSWDGFSSQERLALAQLYVPYLALGRFLVYAPPNEDIDDQSIDWSSVTAVGMGIDMFLRLRKTVTGHLDKEKMG